MKNSAINVWNSVLSSPSVPSEIIPCPALQSPLNRKKSNDLFLTQRKSSQDKTNEVLQRHAELNSYIDILDQKIQKKVQHNEAQILFAYRNHLINVKQQMQEIKERAMANANSSSSQLEKIDSLEKQLIIFREESLKLFEKIVQKDKIIEEMTLNLDELKAEKRHMDNCVKNLTKRNKILEGMHQRDASQIQIDTGLGQIEVNNLKTMTAYKPYYLRGNKGKQRPFTSSTNPNGTAKLNVSHQANNHTVDAFRQQSNTQLQQICRRIRMEMQNCEPSTVQNVIKIIEGISFHQTHPIPMRKAIFYNQKDTMDNKRTRFSMRTKSNHTAEYREQKITRAESFHQSNRQLLVKRSQAHNKSQAMLQFFQNCVQTVKKQIVRRKNVKSINFFKEGNPISVEQFKKIDFFRLLELVFANQKIIQAVHEIIFNLK